MFAEVTYEDGEVESFELAAPTSRARALRNGVWTFKTVDGREISIDAPRAARIELSEIVVPNDARELEEQDRRG